MEKSIIHSLLQDTIVSLCQNALRFDLEIQVEGVVVVTIDRDEVVVVKLNENVTRDVSEDDPTDKSAKSPSKKKRKLSITSQNRKTSNVVQQIVKNGSGSTRSLQQITQDDLFNNDTHGSMSQCEYNQDQNSTAFARHFLQSEGISLVGEAAGYGPYSSSPRKDPAVSRSSDSENALSGATCDLVTSPDADNINAVIQNRIFESSQPQLLPLLKPMSTDMYTSNILDRGPLDTVESLLTLCDRLREESYWHRMYQYMRRQRSKTVGESVRRIMKKLGSNNLWCQYSLKGRKNKLCFIELPIADLIIKCVTDCHPKDTALEVEEEIANVLKYSPKYAQKAAKEQQESGQSTSGVQGGVQGSVPGGVPVSVQQGGVQGSVQGAVQSGVQV